MDGMLDYANAITIQNCIVDGGSGTLSYVGPYAVSVDTSSVVSNSLIIAEYQGGVMF